MPCPAQRLGRKERGRAWRSLVNHSLLRFAQGRPRNSEPAKHTFVDHRREPYQGVGFVRVLEGARPRLRGPVAPEHHVELPRPGSSASDLKSTSMTMVKFPCSVATTSAWLSCGCVSRSTSIAAVAICSLKKPCDSSMSRVCTVTQYARRYPQSWFPAPPAWHYVLHALRLHCWPCRRRTGGRRRAAPPTYVPMRACCVSNGSAKFLTYCEASQHR